MNIQSEPSDNVHRLAWLPIVFMTEQEEVFELYGREEEIEEAYCDVITTSLWVYSLYTYHGLIRRRFGSATEARVRESQRDIFNDEQPGSGDAIIAALELIERALTAGLESDPGRSIRFKMPAELAVGQSAGPWPAGDNKDLFSGHWLVRPAA